MALGYYGRPVPSQMDIVRGCLEYEAFVPDADGGIVGLIYKGFVRYVTSHHGIAAESRPRMTLEELRRELHAGNLVMASVHKEIRQPDVAPARQGGHLVLVIGEDGQGIHFRNPSGHTPQTRQACLEPATFELFYASRGVVLSMPLSPHE